MNPLPLDQFWGAYSNSLANLNPVTNLYEKRKYNGFSGGVFARKFFKLSETFLFSLEGKAMAGNVNRPALQYQDDPRDTRFLFAFRPIFSFVPNNRWFFDASIGDLSYGVNWYSFAIDTDQFTASLGQVRIGVNYLFNKND